MFMLKSKWTQFVLTFSYIFLFHFFLPKQVGEAPTYFFVYISFIPDLFIVRSHGEPNPSLPDATQVL